MLQVFKQLQLSPITLHLYYIKDVKDVFYLYNDVASGSSINSQQVGIQLLNSRLDVVSDLQ